MLNHFYVSKGTTHKNSCVETRTKWEGREKTSTPLKCWQSNMQYCISQNFLSHIGLMLFNFPHSLSIWFQLLSSNTNHHTKYYIHAKFPDFDSFKVFGSLCYASTLQVHITKLDHKARKHIFL